MKFREFIIYITCLLCVLTLPAAAQDDKNSLIEKSLDEYEMGVSAESEQGESASVQEGEESYDAEDALPGEEDIIIFDDEAEGENVIEHITPLMIERLTFNKADILDVIDEIEEKSGLIIVSDLQIEGVVTLDVKNIAARDALRIVLSENDLAFDEEDGILTILTGDAFVERFGYKFGSTRQVNAISINHVKGSELLASLENMKSEIGKIYYSKLNNQIILIDETQQAQEMKEFIQSMDVPLETEVFQLQYIKAKEIAVVIKQRMGGNAGQVTFDERANKIVVTDTVEDINAVRKIIEEFDIKKEILFETKVVRIDLSDEHQKGVDWEAIVADYHQLKGASFPSGEGSVSIGTVSSEDYEVLIDALDLVGDMNSFTAPGSRIVNNTKAYFVLEATKADIHVNMKVQAPNADEIDPNDQDTVGTHFYVSPTIHMDGTMSINLKTLSQKDTSGVEINVNNDHSIVIGSVFREQLVDSTKKFPLLGDIPFLGAVFRSRTSNILKTEYIIFLKPKIIQ